MTRTSTQSFRHLFAVLVLGTACAAPFDIARTGSLSPSPDLPGPVGERLLNAVLNHANEISSRRRLTTVFPNEQSPFHGVQMNFVNVNKGNLTFLNRDLVRLDRLPIVFGRVYDSAKTDAADFGPGWKLSVAESISRRGSQLVYTDASNSRYLLETDGPRVTSPFPHLTGIEGGRIMSGSIELDVAGLTKRFELIGNEFHLAEVSDKWGNTLTLHYDGESISEISSSHARAVSIQRNGEGLITGARGDAGAGVRYEYDGDGRLAAAFGIAGGVWTFAYDQQGRLTHFVDPRENSVLSASYGQSGKVIRIQSLYDDMMFDYAETHTRVETSLQTAATFWHHDSGLTAMAQDFAGHHTTVALDGMLRPAALTFDGATIAEFSHAETQVATITQAIGAQAGTSTLEYHFGGQLRGVVRDGRLVAEYDYDAYGNVIFANDEAGVREYRFSAAGLLQEAVMNGERVGLEMDELGRLVAAKSERQSVRVSYDDHDQVRDMSFLVHETDFYEAAEVEQSYSYGSGGFRADAVYAVSGEILNSVGYRYDDVGNLTRLIRHSPEEGQSTDEYIIGARNELERVTFGRGGARDFEYDRLGRITRYHSEAGSTAFQYDDVGRLSEVSIDGKTMLTSDYGPMDTDPVLEADERTFYTTLDIPVASSVFGPVEAIVYSRPRGAPFGAVRFIPTMGRFILQAPVSPDALANASLKRRAVAFTPVDEHMDRHRHLIPLVGDKPSSSLFIPPEYLSVNCAEVECFSFFGRVHTTVSARTVYVGETVYFTSEVGADAYCYEEWSPGGLFKWPIDHVVYPDDTNWDLAVYGYAPNGTPATMSYTYR